MKKNKRNFSTNKSKIHYDKDADVLWFMLKPGLEENHKEIYPGVNIELGEKGEVLGIEILDASEVLGEIMGKRLITKKVEPSGIAAVAHKIR